MAAICLCAAVVRVRGMNAAAFGVTKNKKDWSFRNLGGLKVVADGPPIKDHWCRWLLKPFAE